MKQCNFWFVWLLVVAVVVEAVVVVVVVGVVEGIVGVVVVVVVVVGAVLKWPTYSFLKIVNDVLIWKINLSIDQSIYRNFQLPFVKHWNPALPSPVTPTDVNVSHQFAPLTGRV